MTLAGDGFTIVPLLDAAAAGALRAAWAELGDGEARPFDAGFLSEDRERKAQAHRLVLDALGGPAADAVPGHRPLIGSFAVKQPDPASGVRPHQDWCVVDERRWRSCNVWCALEDVGEDDGPLGFVPGSHRLSVLRGSGIPHSCRDVVDLADDRFVVVPLRAGEAVVYDHATIHRSTPNRSARTRVAAMLGLVPAGADPVHYRRRDDGSVEVRRAGTDFYLRHAFGDQPLPDAEVLARFDWDGRRVEVADLSR